MTSVTPSSAHICDVARVQEREAIRSIEDLTRHRDIEMNRTLPNISLAAQLEGQILIKRKLLELMETLKGEHCGL